MERRDLRLLVGLAAASAALLLAFATGVVGGALLYAAPVALLAMPLLSGRYVGERSIQRLAARRSARPSRAHTPAPVVPRGPARVAPRGGLLLAACLAERGPPLAVLTR